MSALHPIFAAILGAIEQQPEMLQRAAAKAELRRFTSVPAFGDLYEVTQVLPPIPTGRFDWRATKRDYEPGDAIGTGPTRDAAIADLQAQLDEADEPRDRSEEADDARANARITSDKESRYGF